VWPGHPAKNLAVLRHVALNRRRREQTTRIGIQIKQLMAGWDDTYLVLVLGQS